MTSDMLHKLNEIYKEKEAAAGVEDIFVSLSSKGNGWADDSPRKLQAVKMDVCGSYTVVNDSFVPEELRKRLQKCVHEYYLEMSEKFSAITVGGISEIDPLSFVAEEIV